MKKIRIIIVLLFALFIGFVHGSHHIFMSYFLGREEKIYQPLLISPQVHNSTIDETFVYAPKVNRILLGDFPLKEVGVYESKDFPSIQVAETLPSVLMALLTRLTGSISGAFILADFIFPMLTFLAAFWFLFSMTKNFLISLSGSIFLFFGQVFIYDFPYLPSAIKEIIIIDKFNSLLWFSRTFHPQITFLFLLLTIYLFFKITVQEKISKKLVLLTSVCFGLLFYSYLFYWTWFIAGAGIYFFLLRLKKSNHFLTRRMLAVFTIGLITGSYFFGQWFSQPQNGYLERANTYYFSQFEFIPFLRIVFFSFLFFIFFSAKKSKEYLLIQAYFLGSLLLYLFPYISKINFDDMVGHWDKFCVNSWIILSLFILLANMIKKLNINKMKTLNFFLIFLIFASFCYGWLYHWQFARKNYQAYQIAPSRLALYDWLNENTQKDTVVLTLSFTENLMLPAFTHNNIFMPNFTSGAETKEIVNRFLWANKLLDMNWGKIEPLFLNAQESKLALSEHWNFDQCGGWYIFFYQKGTPSRYLCGIKTDELEEMRQDYLKIKMDPSRTPYRYDYILIGSFERNLNVKLNFGNLNKVYENQDYQLYRAEKN